MKPGLGTSRVLMALLVAVLGVALLVQIRPRLQAVAFPRAEPLEKFLPGDFSGWNYADEPISNTEEVRRAVEWGLNYDEAILRTYRRGDESISVYIAFWNPGKYPPRLVAQHTPDFCWTGVGWDMSNLDRILLRAPAGQQLPVAQYRRFAKPGVTLYVAYWHLVGGRLSGFTEGKNIPSQDILDNWLSELRHGHAEQYFIRIATSVPPEKMLRPDTPLPTILQKVAAISVTTPVASATP